ncbi:high-affinity nicotinic acid transporter [Diplodia corticola]|uniref:High-affinity nicotinic acid transporter n=1 Tax=Diplodia corticola TaxID=236234 RepID=A0A1J9S8K3_9PEZI|nr:high-affinity nicotinic acid transporter [Diplodia corticola]OJD36839.1 high-affinity nicotinic acid transporter [Diplodia corticola]
MSDDKQAAAKDSPAPSQSGAAETHDGTEEGRKAFLASFSAAEDKAIMRKVDGRFLVLIGLIYVIKNIDYMNAANVKVLQVGQPSNILNELSMTADQYNWVQSIYFISYIVFEVPSNLVMKKVLPRNWQTRIILSWGIILACHAAVKNKEGLYAARFCLGMAEAGMFPGLAVQLASWYRTDEYAKPVMWMFAFQNTSGIIGSLLAYGISYMNGLGGLSAWRWVYLLEGLFTILFSIIVYLVLPDYPHSPRSRTWLTPREQTYLEARLSPSAPKTSDPPFRPSEIPTALRDPRTHAFTLAQFLTNLAGYALQWQLPTITTSLGFAALPRNQLLNIPPALGSVLAILAAGALLSRAWLSRPAFIALIGACELVFFAVLAAPVHDKPAVVYAACVLGTVFYSVWFIPFWAWRSASLDGGATAAAFGLAWQNCVGQVGGVVGPQLFRERYAGDGYRVPFAVCAGAVGGAWVAGLWGWWLTWEVEGRVRRERRAWWKERGRGRGKLGDREGTVGDGVGDTSGGGER